MKKWNKIYLIIAIIGLAFGYYASSVFTSEGIRIPVAPEGSAGAKNVTGTMTGDHYGMDVNLSGGSVTTTIYSPSTPEIKKATLSAGADSGTALYPTATSYAVEICNESDNDLYVTWSTTVASSATGVLIKAYGCKMWGGIQIAAAHVQNAGSDAAVVNATYWK